MTMRVMHNKKNLSATLHFTGANTVVVAGNSSVSSIALPGEVLTGAYITQVWAGSSSGASDIWKIKRGANTVAVLDSTTYMDFAGNGASLTLDHTANVVIEFTGTAGFLMIELQKVGNIYDNEYFQN